MCQAVAFAVEPSGIANLASFPPRSYGSVFGRAWSLAPSLSTTPRTSAGQCGDLSFLSLPLLSPLPSASSASSPSSPLPSILYPLSSVSALLSPLSPLHSSPLICTPLLLLSLLPLKHVETLVSVLSAYEQSGYDMSK